MSSLGQEYYSISDAAKRLEKTPEQVEYYLETGKLLASIKLPLMMLNFMDDITSNAIGFDDVEDFDDFIDVYTTELYEGIFVITRYDRIRWDIDNACDFHKNEISLCEHNNWEHLQVFKFTDSYVVRKNEIIIEEQSINRFLKKCNYDLTPHAGLVPLEQALPPYLNRNHPRFSPELETAISAWLNIYDSGSFKKNLAHKYQIKQWIEQNRKEFRFLPEAIERIATVVNYDKRNPRKKTR
jgi:hypothetical protein